MKQISLAQAEFAAQKRVTKREKFLAEMKQVIPWQDVLAMIEPHCPKDTRGRPPVGLERLLQMLFIQQWYHL